MSPEPAAIRALALTPEQEALRAELAKRNAAIQAGIKAPASGTFGKPKP